MIGYITNKNSFYKGDIVNYNLEKAVAFSGGTVQHYNIFREILTYSSYNTETEGIVHDTRATQFLLYQFPLKLQVILSLLCYQEDNLIASNLNIDIKFRNVLKPSSQIKYAAIINRKTITRSLLEVVDQYKDTSINNSELKEIRDLFNINQDFNKLTTNFQKNVEVLLEDFGVLTRNIQDYIPIVESNDRLKTIIAIAISLNYKTQSLTYLTQAVTQWYQISST